MATHSSILVWKIPWTKEPGGLQSMGWQGVRHRVTNAFAFFLSQFSSVTQVFPTLWDHKDCRAPGVPVHHQLPELAQTHVHWLSDAIQLPLSSPSLPAFNFSQHLGLFQWVSSSHQVAKVLGLQLLHQSFQWIFRTDFLYDWLVGSPCSPRDSQESSPTPQFKSIDSSAFSFLYSPNFTSIHDYWQNHNLTRWTFVDKLMSLLFIIIINLFFYWRIIPLQNFAVFCQTST